jgi:hypothetical protein
MYACILEIGGEFFEGVCAPSNAPANFRDPPPTLSAKEPEPCRWGSGPIWIMRRLTVGGALAWGRGKPSLAHCQSTARMPPTRHAARRTYALKASRADAHLVGTPSCSRHDDHCIRSSTSCS